MKTLKFTILAAAALTTLAACNSNVETTENGILLQAGENTISIVNVTGDTLTFGTATAETLGDVVMTGDSVSVTFVGEIAPAGSETPTAATKVVSKHIARTSESLIGSWVETVVNGKDTTVQGIQIFEGGVASSINNAPVVYKNWTSTGSSIYADADVIVLNGEVVEKEVATPFADTLSVKVLSADSLVASNTAKTIRLAKQK